LAAQTFYPGTSNVPPPPPPPPGATPPSAVVSASPTAGPPPLNSGFDGSASKAGTNPIASYTWNFGDGSSGTGATCGHLYNTAGTYTATLTVTDTQGATSNATQTINVAMSGQIMHANLKLNLKTMDKDSLSLLLYSQDTAMFTPSGPVTGTFNLAGTPFTFNLSQYTLKGSGANGLQVTVSKRTGYVVVTMKNADLETALTAAGIDTTASGSVSIPFSLVFGDGSKLGIYNVINLNVSAKVGRSALGHY
jgi:PKD repeat protein